MIWARRGGWRTKSSFYSEVVYSSRPLQINFSSCQAPRKPQLLFAASWFGSTPAESSAFHRQEGTSMICMKRLIGTALLSLMYVATATAQDRFITIASTTSTEQSGLFSHILPKFKETSGIDVRVVAVGTGQAFAIARRGDADALLVHDTAGEEKFIADGYGLKRADVMYNDVGLIGAANDPAKVPGGDSARDAFARIAKAKSPFASRGDDSGTHRSELRLWDGAGVKPEAPWYRELGSGMGPTLNTAAGMNAYVFADRGTWIAFD